MKKSAKSFSPSAPCCRTGEIPHIRLSARCYRVRQADLDDYLRTKMR